MDDFDRASETEQRDRDLCIANARRSTKRIPTGFCDYCNAVIHEGLYCDAECRDDAELERAAMRRNGR